MSQQDELDGIVGALDTLMSAIHEDNKRKAGDLTVPQSARDRVMQWTFEETQLELAAYELIRNPVGRALRVAVKTLGERLNERGGSPLMLETLDRVAALKPEQEGWRQGMLDRLWDGIGDWLA